MAGAITNPIVSYSHSEATPRNHLLVDQPLIKAQAKDYVRLTQERLIGMPLLNQLETDTAGGGSLERGLLALLDGWRKDGLIAG